MKNIYILVVVVMLIAGCTVKQSAEPTLFTTPEATTLPDFAEPASPSNCPNVIKPGLLPESLSKTHIVYQGYDENGQPLLWVVSMMDGERTLLEDYPGTVSGLGFLEDGQHFLIAIGDGKQAWLGNIDGSPAVKVDLTEDILSNFQPYSPIWSELVGLPENIVDYRNGRFHSPNNQVIASWKRGDKALVLIDQNTKQETVVIPTSAQDTIYGKWTPDSKWFIFAYDSQTPDGYFGQLLKINFEGTELSPLTDKSKGSFIVSPVMSPDNKKVAIIDSGVNDTLVVLWVDSGETRSYPLNFTIASSFGDRVIWSPDSQWLAFFSEWDQVDIRVMNIENGNIYCATKDNIIENLMDWR